MRQEFGGSWTEKKLGALEGYLSAYMRIMRQNEKARHFTVTYLDGFAGSGRRYGRSGSSDQATMADLNDDDRTTFTEGSARVALGVATPFDKYRFVDNDPDCVVELENLKVEFPSRDVKIVQGDANKVVRQWAKSLANLDRAVVFLDPYGMQVEWQTLVTLAATNKVDLWLLVPVGQAIMRLLTQEGPPDSWAAALTRLFGTEDWRDEFYATSDQEDLFDGTPGNVRVVDYDRITQFMIGRLRTIFAGVLETPVVLRNSTGIHLYILCFAVSNERAVKPALTIARALARKFNNGGK